MKKHVFFAAFGLGCWLFISSASVSFAAHVYKIASLAPEGSVWVTAFRAFAEEVDRNTAGEVKFKIYPGGIMGDDRAMYRKMRAGQLHGGGFTMTGAAEFVPDFRIMAIPFLFKSYDEVDYVREQLLPYLKGQFSNKGIELIAMTEVGFIYTFSAKPRTTIEELQDGKTWAPSNDPLTATFLQSIDISPITLTIPDVLSSLQTGLIDTAFNSLYGSIVLQWFTKAPYVTDQPYGYAYGCFSMSTRSLAKLNPEQLRVIENAAQTHFSELLKSTRQSNIDSRAVLAQQGVSFVKTSPEIVARLESHRDKTIARVKGKSFSETAYDKLEAALNSYRN
ncbi:MAG: TRAP transporter substrate-binding protein DctP [Desulfobulbaceae bacterium]|nr:MAG: TRAP transporter substrate-binding protein DctP [Desulfobulbaceae bacterium]